MQARKPVGTHLVKKPSCWRRACPPLVMVLSASLSVVSQLLSVCIPSGLHGWELPSYFLSAAPGILRLVVFSA